MAFVYGAGTDLLYIQKNNVNNRLLLGGEWGNAGGLVTAINGIAETGWMHLAITMSVAADELITYYNGTQEGPTLNGLLTQSDITLDAVRNCCGSYTTTPTLLFSGYVAHAAIWTSALTPTQIASLASV